MLLREAGRKGPGAARSARCSRVWRLPPTRHCSWSPAEFTLMLADRGIPRSCSTILQRVARSASILFASQVLDVGKIKEHRQEHRLSDWAERWPAPAFPAPDHRRGGRLPHRVQAKEHKGVEAFGARAQCHPDRFAAPMSTGSMNRRRLKPLSCNAFRPKLFTPPQWNQIGHGDRRY